MRLIDADALIVATKRKAPISDAMRVMWAECLEEIRHAPTIEPERKKGKWIPHGEIDKDGNQYYNCSVCQCGETHVPTVKVRYCWNCGADMRGDEE